MIKPKIRIKISTRLLIYFLLVAILPIFILAISLTLILNSQMNAALDSIKNSINYIILEIALFSALAGITLSYVLAMLINKPISKITKAATAIENGDFSQKVEVKSGDEIGYLAETFNKMAIALQKRQELEQIKEDFAATLTHDLKVPLMANVQTLEYLLKGSYGELAEKQSYITEHLISNNKDLLKMVNTILDSYRYEAGKHTLNMRKADINILIEECVKDLNSLIIEKKHRITFNKLLNPIEVLMDRDEIKRVILNLIGNAIIYTHTEGEIKINSEIFEDNIIVSVEDNGIGITEESLNYIFERYSKCSYTLRKVGTGLGLYLSKQIIEAHNGKIWVHSIPDKGSTFYFSIPASIRQVCNDKKD